MQNFVIPKTFEHWCRSIGLELLNCYPEHGYAIMRSNHAEYRKNCIGQYRYFRLMSHLDVIQICDGDFDRWANSVGGEIKMPKTRDEFTKAICSLVESAKPEAPNVEEYRRYLFKRIELVDMEIDEEKKELQELRSIYREYVIKYGCKAKYLKRLIHRTYQGLLDSNADKRRHERKLQRLSLFENIG